MVIGITGMEMVRVRSWGGVFFLCFVPFFLFCRYYELPSSCFGFVIIFLFVSVSL